MSLTSLLLPDGELRVVRCDIIDKLINCGDGDSALLYLYIVKTGTRLNEKDAMRELNFSKERYERASYTLTNLMIRQQAENDTNSAPEKLIKPKYTPSELSIAREKDHKFSAVCDCAEDVFGNVLSDVQVRTLYTIYDHIGLSAEVIIELLTYLKRDRQKVTRRDIEREAHIWSDEGIYTYQDAQKHLEKLEAEKPLIEAIFDYMHIIGREPSTKERQFAQSCIKKGFPPETVKLAIDRMEGQIEKFSLNYLKRILLSWHEKGVHTISEITAIEPEVVKKLQNAEPKQPPVQADKLEDWEIEWLKNFEKRRQDN